MFGHVLPPLTPLKIDVPQGLTPEQQNLIDRSNMALDLLGAIFKGKAVWRPFGSVSNTGELLIEGVRFYAMLDEYGVPKLSREAVEALRKANGRS